MQQSLVIEKNKPLKPYNTFNVDSVAKSFININNEAVLHNIIHNNMLEQENFFILGNGSNILFVNEAYDGVILKNNLKTKCDIKIVNNNIEITASSGIDFDSLIKKYLHFQAANNITAFGLENLALIPGNVGAAVVQNIGAYGVEQKDFFVECTITDLKTGATQKLSKSECKFNYRQSVFKSDKTLSCWFITEVKYSVPIDTKPVLSYKALRNYFEEQQILITPQAIYSAVAQIRNEKIPPIEEFPNAGSFFKNPIITKDKLNKILSVNDKIGYVLEKDIVKLSAASLIENAGLRGKRIGNVGISDKHSLIVINYNNATGKEIKDFSQYIIQTVSEKYDIELLPEVIFVE